VTYGDVSSGQTSRRTLFGGLFRPQNLDFADGQNYVGISMMSWLSGSQSRV
jgi:hypothetical protein